MSKNTKKNGKYAKQQELQRLLWDSTKTIEEGRIEREVKCHGLRWALKPLNDHESNWRNKYVIPGSLISIHSSPKSPTLAIGIRAIGPADAETLSPVEEFFKEEWETLTSKARDLFENNEYAKQYFLAEQMYEFLSTKDPKYVDELWDKWLGMTEDQEEAEKELGESSSLDGNQETKSGLNLDTDSETKSKSTHLPLKQSSVTVEEIED